MLKKIRYIFSKQQKMRATLLLTVMIIGSFMELLGVSIFVPFISIVMNPEQIQEISYLKWIFGVLNEPTVEMFVVYMALAIAFIYIIKNLYLALMQNEILKFSYNVRMNIAVRLLKTYIREPYTFHLGKNIAELQRTLTTDASQFMTFVNSILQLVSELVVCFVIGLYLFHTSHSITVVIVGLLGVCVGVFAIISKKISTKLGLQNQKYNAQLFQWINQSLGGIKEVKVLEREKYFIDIYSDNYRKLIKSAKNNELISAIPKYIVEAMAMSGMLLAVVFKIFFGRRAIIDFIPQLSAFAVAAFRLMPSVGKINAYVNSFMYSVPSVDLIYNDLKEVEGLEIDEETLNSTSMKFDNRLSVNNVVFSYPDSDEKVLNNVSMIVNRGETVALIGPSGAGKTTLVDVILGLLKPLSGDIVVDGKSIYDNMGQWHRCIGYIPQTIYLSDDTIINNVAFGIPSNQVDMAAVKNALKKAQLLEFAESLDKGLDTIVGEQGIRLSGGQRQRIGIARALYHNPEVLILDEATSALDNDTESAVMSAIEHLHGEKTIIIIAHRLTTVRNADKIYEVCGGKVTIKTKDEVFG